MSKAGVEQLGRALRVELVQHGASASVAYFGFIDTEMVRESIDAGPARGPDVATDPARAAQAPAAAGRGRGDRRGIERAQPRIIGPRRWAILSVLRGVLNPLTGARGARRAGPGATERGRRPRAMKIFLSYRREDTSGHAGRLYDLLVRRYGAEQIFMDIDAIPVGSEFGEEIHRAVASCDVFIALIGPRWAHVTGPDGGRRLDDADDYLRQEVESALASDVRVVPVCVQGADLPSADVLPPSLAPLVERQGTKLGDASWHDDVERLVRRLEGRPPRRRTRTLLLAAVVGVLALVGVAVALALQDDGEPSLNEPGQRSSPASPGRRPAPDACGPRSSHGAGGRRQREL